MRPSTCRHDPLCGSEVACVLRNQAEGEGYRRQRDERLRDEEASEARARVEDFFVAAKRGVIALERISVSLQRLREKADMKLATFKFRMGKSK